jgi:hypothetical protein
VVILLPILALVGLALADAGVAGDGRDGKSPRDPFVMLALDHSAYAPGQLMTLTLADNLWAKHTWAVSDTAGRVWTMSSESRKGAVYTATAGHANATVTARLTRSWDGATATASVSYSVTGETAPSTSSPSPAPTSTTGNS